MWWPPDSDVVATTSLSGGHHILSGGHQIKKIFSAVVPAGLRRNPWKRRRLVAGRFPAAGRSPVGHPDAFHCERVTGWSPVGGRLAHWNAPFG